MLASEKLITNDNLQYIYYSYIEIFRLHITLVFLLFIDLLFYSSGQKYEAPLMYCSKSKQINIRKLKITIKVL